MIRNSIVAAATAVVAAFAIWFQATQTVSHEVKNGERGTGTSQVEPAETPAPAPGAISPSESGGGDERSETETNDEGGKPGEVKP